ncbi:MAG: DUF6438 domain-containing protein [Flavobacteriales bacterium]
MKNLLLSLTVLVSAASFIGCKSTEKSASATSTSSAQAETTMASEPQLLASIQRTACYGQCPMYKATFLDNGEVKYVGKRFVENIGTYTALIPAEKVQQIKDMAREYKYFELDSLYPTPISDFPSCLTEVRLNGISKRVVNRRSPPENLRDFEKYLDGILKEVELTKVSDETIYDQPAK